MAKTVKTPQQASSGVLDARAYGKQGGHARAAKLTAAQRSAIAALGGKKAKGWPKGKPRGPRTNWGNAKPFGKVQA